MNVEATYALRCVALLLSALEAPVCLSLLIDRTEASLDGSRLVLGVSAPLRHFFHRKRLALLYCLYCRLHPRTSVFRHILTMHDILVKALINLY